ncbi:DUF3017 domain-containing protein [Antrihabitans cavernicola]|uniref:DUF3017 domain-containing protein n=1 Tax=Antrihabitans cavernicola TaxID=2495913 RepID=A0A5A7SD99_9NOCA|nr:DUF3017 domain-containing protein [Spelaeibacter cavernicola]KAA0022707.1 DUF3017 domain-containing protein [Spelaeibacter cavernicola]
MTADLTQTQRLTRFVRCHLPMVVVVAVIVAAVVLVLSDRWRRGAIVFGVATLLAGAFRFVLPDDQVGLLHVRSKRLDAGALFVVGTAIVWLAFSIDPLGTG